ncbi:MAG: prepilin-type N-terminal cleavage/methylation domain-containing protein [Planctomycetota bacterium]
MNSGQPRSRQPDAAAVALAGFSLIELLAAVAITGTLMASSMVVIRSSYAAWQAHEGDLERTEAAYAVLRHIVRGIRQADGVASVTAASDTTGKLELVTAGGSNVYWEHTGTGDGVVVYNGTTGVLAMGIDQLSFTAYEADGATATTTADDIQLIRCTAKVTLPRGAGQTRTVTSYGWIRSW